jgi:hypothetical protein
MMLESMRDFEMFGLCPCPGRLDLGDGGYDESEVIEHLRRSVAMRATMQREVITSGGQICVVGVRLPYQPHAEHARIELRGALYIRDLEREMAKSAMLNQVRAFPSGMTLGNRIGRSGFIGASIFSNASPI